MRRRVLFIHLAHPTLVAPHLRGILDYAGPRERWEIFRYDDFNIESNRYDASHFDGILLYSFMDMHRHLRRWKAPVVAIHGDTPGPAWGAVGLDNEAIGRMAGKYLMGLGIKRFGYWGPDVPWSLHREAGFREVTQRRGAPCQTVHDLADTPKNVDWAALGRADLPRWLEGLEPPVGVLGFNDAHARNIIHVARDLGLRVPEDLAVMGVDNDLCVCEPTAIPITSIDNDLVRVGFLAAELLDRMMAGAAPPATPLLVPPREIVKRRSTDSLAIEDRDVRVALAYIREHACEGITIKDVLERVPICRRILEKRFAESVGHTPAKELRRVKLQRAATLLRDTTFKLESIASQCGYRNRTHLSAAFFKEFKVTASAYRRQ